MFVCKICYVDKRYIVILVIVNFAL